VRSCSPFRSHTGAGKAIGSAFGTHPGELNVLAMDNPRLFYDLLFTASAQTLLEVAADPKHLGAEIGVTSILCGIVYTGGPYPLGYNGLGDVFVFIFFGLVAVCTTYFVQAGELNSSAVICAVGIGLLATNILVVNNYRDVETDQRAGKRTLVVRFGRRFARIQFGVSLFVALTIPVHLLRMGFAPLVLLPIALVPMAWRHANRLGAAATPSELITLLGDTGRLLALYAVFLSVGVAV